MHSECLHQNPAFSYSCLILCWLTTYYIYKLEIIIFRCLLWTVVKKKLEIYCLANSSGATLSCPWTGNYGIPFLLGRLDSTIQYLKLFRLFLQNKLLSLHTGNFLRHILNVRMVLIWLWSKMSGFRNKPHKSLMTSVKAKVILLWFFS